MLDVTVRSDEGPAESVPVAWFEAPAAADGGTVGDEVVVVGRVRRRFFRAGGATASRTEVVATTVLACSPGRPRPQGHRIRGHRSGARMATMNQEQLQKVREGNGFIAALDQSGGSTPKALQLYGVGSDEYANDDEMFDRMHEMRSRIVTSPSFSGDRVLGAILFENTMDRQIEGRDSGDYLWSDKGVVPFLKVDKGLADEADGAQVMKPIPGLDELLTRAVSKGMFGTKMRSVIKRADQAGVDAVVNQQFEVGRQILDAGLVPIIEPEVDIHSPDKAEAEALLRDAILAQLERLPDDKQVMLKLTLPEADGFHGPLVEHPKVLRVVALSGGYSREEANDRLARNPGLIASFSRRSPRASPHSRATRSSTARSMPSIKSIYEASLT